MLLALVLVACEEAVVEGITSNTTVEGYDFPSLEPDAGIPMTGGLKGTSWRLITLDGWPDVWMIVAFGSNGRYYVEYVSTQTSALRNTGTWDLSDGVLSLQTGQSYRYSADLRRVDKDVLCWYGEDTGSGSPSDGERGDYGPPGEPGSPVSPGSVKHGARVSGQAGQPCALIFVRVST